MYKAGFWRFDSLNSDPILINFLNLQFPKGKEHVEGIAFPKFD
jgi:hypothetical protein